MPATPLSLVSDEAPKPRRPVFSPERRERIASAVLQGLLSTSGSRASWPELKALVPQAVELADLLIQELSKE